MKKFLLKTMLLLFALVVGSGTMWADDPVTITSLINNTTTGWDISGATSAGSGTGLYWKLINNSDYIQSPSITWSDYTDITIKIKARTFGGVEATKNKISVSQGSTELTSYTPTNTTLTYSSELSISPSSGALKIACLGANGSKGSGISEIIIKGKLASTAEATTIVIITTGVKNNIYDDNTDGGTLTATVYDSSEGAIDAAAVTWSSSDQTVATIDSETGVITLKKVGSTTITASYAGVTDVYQSSSAKYTLTVINENPALETIWSEDFATSGYSTRSTTYSYATTNSSAVQAGDNYAGGTAPEMMLKASSGTFSATIPLNNGYSGDLKMKFKSNAQDITVSSGTTGVSMSGTASFSTLGTHEVTFTGITAENTAINIVFTAGTSKNVRLDDIVLKGLPAPTKPTFSPVAGDILKGSEVTISAADGAAIYYTTNGSTPTTSSSLYDSENKPTITAATTIKAIAVLSDISSAIATASYTLLKPNVPEFSVAAKTFDKAFDMTITGATGTTLKYTTDGTNPSSSGTATSVASNSKTITISTGDDVTVKAIAILDGVESNVAEVTYEYDARPTPTFTLSYEELNIKVNEASSVTLTTNTDGTISATSSDGTHLPVSYNSSTKVCSFTPNQAGDYTITISVPATSNYLAAEAIVAVHVTKKATSITTTSSFTSKDLYVTTSGSFTGVAKYNDAAIVGAEVTYSSSNTAVATINSSTGAVSYKKAGTTTLTASYAGTDEYAASEATYELVLVDTTPQDVEVDITLNNTFFGCDAFTSYAKDSPTSYSGEKSNVTVTYDKGTGSGFYCNASGIRLYSGGKLTFSAPTGYVITEIAMTGEDDFSDGLTNPDATDTWTGKASPVDITGETKSGSTRKNMTGAKVTLAETVTVGSAGYTTYVAKHDISFPASVTAYIATETGENTVTLSSKASVPDGTAVVIKGEEGTYALPTIKTTPESVTGNLLEASDGSVTGNGSTIYALGRIGGVGDVGFYKVTSGVKVPEGKAYLEIADPGVHEFLEFAFDEETGITEVAEKTEVTEKVFDLSGRRVVKPTRGLYIVNGKKVFIKK